MILIFGYGKKSNKINLITADFLKIKTTVSSVSGFTVVFNCILKYKKKGLLHYLYVAIPSIVLYNRNTIGLK